MRSNLFRYINQKDRNLFDFTIIIKAVWGNPTHFHWEKIY